MPIRYTWPNKDLMLTPNPRLVSRKLMTRDELIPAEGGNALIATNGAQTGLDIARMMLAGASAVEMSTPVMMRGAETLSGALAELQSYLERKNLNASDLIGVAADRRRTFQAMPLKTGNWKNYVAS